MATDFRFVVSDPKSRRAVQISKERNQCEAVMGKKIGESFSGDIVGMSGYELTITGGSDKDGFPMRKDVHGPNKKKILITQGVGFRAKETRKSKDGSKHVVDMRNGVRKKKTVRGNTISEESMQINCKISKEGQQSFEELFPTKKEETQEAQA